MWNADLTRKLNSWSVSKVQYNRAWSLYKWSSMLLNPCLQILLDSIQWDIIHSPTEVIIKRQFVWRMFLDKFVIFPGWLVEALIYWTEYSSLGSFYTAQCNPVKSMRIECHDVKLETNLITFEDPGIAWQNAYQVRPHTFGPDLSGYHILFSFLPGFIYMSI